MQTWKETKETRGRQVIYFDEDSWAPTLWPYLAQFPWELTVIMWRSSWPTTGLVGEGGAWESGSWPGASPPTVDFHFNWIRLWNPNLQNEHLELDHHPASRCHGWPGWCGSVVSTNPWTGRWPGVPHQGIFGVSGFIPSGGVQEASGDDFLTINVSFFF